jgi:hypothetical protein
MKATTGYPRGIIEKSELVTLLTNALRSKDKVCEFTLKSLRSAKYKINTGGTVT